MKTFNEAFELMRKSKYVRHISFPEGTYIYKYEDCLLSNNDGFLSSILMKLIRNDDIYKTGWSTI